MAERLNQLFLKMDGTEYPCLFLEKNLGASPDDRESFVDIGPGHEPICARVFMSSNVLKSMSTDFKYGRAACSVVMRCVAGLWNLSGTSLSDPTPATREILTGPIFYLTSANVARMGVNVDVYELVLTTIQQWWQFMPVGKVFNLLAGTKTEYAAGATSASFPKSYQQVLDALGTASGKTLGTLPITPTAAPHEMDFRVRPVENAIAQLLRPLSMQLVANPWQSSTDMTFSVAALDYTDTGELSALDTLANALAYDGRNSSNTIQTNATNSSAPEKVEVQFPIYPAPTPSGPTDSLATRYTSFVKNNPQAAKTIANTKDVLVVGNHYDVSGKLYSEDLDTVATERATRYFARANINPTVHVLIGGYTITPGKTIRRVRVTMDLDGWFTTVWRHGLYDAPREGVSNVRLNKAPFFPEMRETLGSVDGPRDDGTYTAGGGGALSTGQYQYMVYQMVTQNVAGWDWVRGHPTL